jgi:2-dehydropantoate 2-reductase
MKKNLNILVYGGGAVGSYFAGMMSHNGQNVTLITRGDHLKKIKNQGLVISSEWGEFTQDIRTSDFIPNETFDLAILAVKTYSIKDLLLEFKNKLSYKTKIICLQNGVYTNKFLSTNLPNHDVIDGLTYVDAIRSEAGKVNQFGEEAKIVIGKKEIDILEEENLVYISNIIDSKEVQFEYSRDIEKSVWEKLILVAASGSIMCYANSSAQVVFNSEKYFNIMTKMTNEMFLAAKSIGVNINDEYPENMIKGLVNRAGEIHSSLKEDLDNKRPLELDQILGEVLRIGSNNGVDMNNCKMVYDALSPYIEGK